MKTLIDNRNQNKVFTYKKLEDETFPQVIVCRYCSSEIEVRKKDCYNIDFTFKGQIIPIPSINCICGQQLWLFANQKIN